MCGIVGEYRFDNEKIDKNLFKAKIEAINHRGPDDNGEWVGDRCALGHVRLSIIDLSKNGAQPMVSKKNNIISYNGELYNYLELKQNFLKKTSFNGNSDTEVLLKLMDLNINFLTELRGMFAFAYYNIQNDELLLVRDQLGIKPLYYHVNQNRIVFGSEIKTILKDNEYKIDVNEVAVKEHLILGYSQNNETIFKGIRRLGEGEFIKVNSSGYSIQSYFKISEFLKPTSEKQESLDKTMNHSIKSHSLSDVKLGMMLSGGFDSNLILRYLKSTKCIDSDFIAFNAGIDSDKRADKNEFSLLGERKIAQIISKSFNVKLNKIDVTSQSYFSVKDFIQTVEEPVCNPSGFLINEICRQAKKNNNKVLFSGHGGDEVFGGYRRHVAINFISKIKFLKFISHLIPTKYIKANDLYRIISALRNNKFRFFELSCIGKQFLNDGLINKSFITTQDLNRMATDFQKPIKNMKISDLKKMMMLEFKGYLGSQNLINMDKCSMLNSIEVRVPLLNLEILKKGFSYKNKNLINFKKNKIPLRKLASKFLPSEIFKLKKSGFGPSMKDLIYSDEVQNLLLSESTKKRNLFNVKLINIKLKEENLSNSDMMELLNFAFVEQWYRIYID